MVVIGFESGPRPCFTNGRIPQIAYPWTVKVKPPDANTNGLYMICLPGWGVIAVVEESFSRSTSRWVVCSGAVDLSGIGVAQRRHRTGTYRNSRVPSVDRCRWPRRLTNREGLSDVRWLILPRLFDVLAMTGQPHRLELPIESYTSIEGCGFRRIASTYVPVRLYITSRRTCRLHIDRGVSRELV